MLCKITFKGEYLASSRTHASRVLHLASRRTPILESLAGLGGRDAQANTQDALHLELHLLS